MIPQHLGAKVQNHKESLVPQSDSKAYGGISVKKTDHVKAK
jgi:hypothetical protein